VKLALSSSVVLLLLFLLAACGGGDDQSSSDAEVPPPDGVSSGSSAGTSVRSEGNDNPSVILNNVLAGYVESFDGSDGARFDLI